MHRNGKVAWWLAAFVMGCDGEGDSRSCNSAACGDPFTVVLQMGDFAGPTTVEIEAEGETATLDCPPAPEPRQSTRCEPEEYVGERFRFAGGLWNTDLNGKFMNVTVTQLGEPIGPSNARVVVRSGAEVLFDESFEALGYGEGREINGPGCGRCYGPVTFDRSLRQPSNVDGSTPPDGG